MTYRIEYVCPMLGNRCLIVFNEKMFKNQLARLKNLGYKIISTEQK